MHEINIWAAFGAALSSFLLGGLWYSGLLFGKRWCREAGVDMQQGHTPRVFLISFLFSLLAAFAFAWWLGPRPELHDAVHNALLVGIGFVAASFGINYQFAGRSFSMWLIDAGYHLLQFILLAVILSLWH